MTVGVHRHKKKEEKKRAKKNAGLDLETPVTM